MARNDYEELLGWPVALHVTARRLTIAAGHFLDAVSMPTALGTRVQRQLRIVSLDGPVVAGPRQGWLTFLTGLSDPADPQLPEDLRRAEIRLVMRRERVEVPTVCMTRSPGEVRWFSPPRPRRSPPAWSVVIGMSRRVVTPVRQAA
jgi:hypothetical protein